MACLDERRRALGALTELFSHADAQVVERAPQATAALAGVEQCADVTALRAPTPAGGRRRRARASTSCAPASPPRALEQPGQLPEALALAEAAVTRAKATAYQPVEAEALEELGAPSTRTAKSARDRYVRGRRCRRNRRHATSSRRRKARARSCTSPRSIGRTRADTRPCVYADAAVDRDADEDRPDRLDIPDALIAQDEIKLGDALATRSACSRGGRRCSPPSTLDGRDAALAGTLDSPGHYDEATVVQRRALAIREKVLGPAHPLVAATHLSLGNPLMQKGDYDGAIAEYRRAFELRVAIYGNDSPFVADALSNMGVALMNAGRLDEGLEPTQRALSIREKVLPPDHEDILDSLNNVAALVSRMNRWRTRSPPRVARSRSSARTQGPSSPRLISAYTVLGEPLRHLGRTAEALAILERAVSIAHATDGDPDVSCGSRVGIGARAQERASRSGARSSARRHGARHVRRPARGQRRADCRDRPGVPACRARRSAARSSASPKTAA